MQKVSCKTPDVTAHFYFQKTTIFSDIFYFANNISSLSIETIIDFLKLRGKCRACEKIRVRLCNLHIQP